MRKYRVHLFDGSYELLTDETHAITLDLDTAEGHAAAERALANRISALVRRAQATGEYARHPRLEVRDWLTGRKELDWC